MSRKKSDDEENVQLENVDELLSYFNESEGKNKRDVKRHDLDTFSLITFLENDGQRLDRLISVFRDKLNNHQQYNQVKILLEGEAEKNLKLEAHIVNSLKKPDSSLNKSLARLFNAQMIK